MWCLGYNKKRIDSKKKIHMHSPFLPIESGLDLRKQAKQLGVSLWHTPAFFSLLLGAVVIFFMGATYLIFSYSNNAEALVLIESGIVMSSLLIGGLIIRLLEEIAVIRKLKSDFISAMSHRLKSPLAQIKWHIDLCRSKNSGDGNDGSREAMRSIELSNEHLIRMVDEFLMVSRFESGEVRWYEERINISNLMKKVCDRYRMDIQQKNIRLLFEVFGEEKESCGDARKIEMVLENVFLNALRYTDRSGTISLYIRNKEKEIEVDIKDTGIGIPIEHQGKIFEKFFRSDNAMLLNTEGVGLGLNLCQRIMDRVGGSIRFESKKGRGTTFFLVFPRKLGNCEIK